MECEMRLQIFSSSHGSLLRISLLDPSSRSFFLHNRQRTLLQIFCSFPFSLINIQANLKARIINSTPPSHVHNLITFACSFIAVRSYLHHTPTFSLNSVSHAIVPVRYLSTRCMLIHLSFPNTHSSRLALDAVFDCSAHPVPPVCWDLHGLSRGRLSFFVLLSLSI